VALAAVVTEETIRPLLVLQELQILVAVVAVRFLTTVALVALVL
jgi:hypothetical protein